MKDVITEPTRRPEERAYEYFDNLLETLSKVTSQLYNPQLAQVDPDDMNKLRIDYNKLRIMAGDIEGDYPLHLPDVEQNAVECVIGFIDDLKKGNFYTIGHKRAKLLNLHRHTQSISPTIE